jgi:uncharacterized protein with WD repeat
VRWGGDGRYVIGWTNQQVIVWNAATGSQVLVLKAELFAAAAVSPDGNRLATVTTELRGEAPGSTIAVWNLPAVTVPK